MKNMNEMMKQAVEDINSNLEGTFFDVDEIAECIQEWLDEHEIFDAAEADMFFDYCWKNVG